MGAIQAPHHSLKNGRIRRYGTHEEAGISRRRWSTYSRPSRHRTAETVPRQPARAAAGCASGGTRTESPAPPPITIDSAHSSYTMTPLPPHESDHARYGAPGSRYTVVKTLRPCLFLSMMILFFFVYFIFFADSITAFIFRYMHGSILFL